MGYTTVVLLRNKTIKKKKERYQVMECVTHSFKCSMGDRLSNERLPIFQEFTSLTLKT